MADSLPGSVMLQIENGDCAYTCIFPLVIGTLLSRAVTRSRRDAVLPLSVQSTTLFGLPRPLELFLLAPASTSLCRPRTTLHASYPESCPSVTDKCFLAAFQHFEHPQEATQFLEDAGGR